jgi:two-component system sensor histidine kinase PilS (NtrC family)
MPIATRSPGASGEAQESARWLVRMRTGSLVAGTIGVVAVSLVLPGTFWPEKTLGLVAVILVLAAANALLHGRVRRGEARTRDIFLSIALDVIAVTVALHMTGGIENPFQIYYTFPVILAGIALPRAQSYAIAALASTLFAGVGLLEFAKVIAHHDVAHLPLWEVIGPQAVDQYEDARYVAGASFVLLSTLLGATYLTTAVAARLRRNEHELSLAKDRLESVLRALGEGVAYFDATGDLVLQNDAFERLLPGTRRLLEGAPPGLLAPLERALASIQKGSPFETFEARCASSGAPGERVLACGLSSVRGAGGIAWVLEDVTLRRTAEERARTERRLADLGVLAAGIAHEVLNPLASIDTTAQLLEADAGALAPQVGQIRRQVDRITRIVRGVAELARPSARGPTPVPIDEVLSDAIARAREERPGSGEVKLEVSRPAPVAGVAEEPMRVAVKNLVTNAIDATEGKGHVTVRARSEGGFVVVEVEDDGPGISAANRESIFVPFFTTKPPGSGAGLGLAIAASIVRQHGGKIDVAAERPGARFTVRLPAAAPAPAKAAS